MTASRKEIPQVQNQDILPAKYVSLLQRLQIETHEWFGQIEAQIGGLLILANEASHNPDDDPVVSADHKPKK